MNTFLSNFISNHKWFLLLSVGYFASRLLFFDTDFHVLEPDEGLYYGLMQYFSHGTWPIYHGQLYLETFPLFIFLASVLQTVTSGWGIFVSLRLLSVFGGWIGGVSLYYFLCHFWSKKDANFLIAIYWLLPISFFYSRSGVYEMLYVNLAMASILLFILACYKKRLPLVQMSAILFAFALLIKPNALVFSLGFILPWIFSHQKIAILKTWLGSFISTLFIPLGLYLFSFGSAILSDSSNMAGRHLLPLSNIRVHLAILSFYLDRSVDYLSLSGVILVGMGFVFSLWQMVSSYSRRVVPDPLVIACVSLFLCGLVFVSLFDFSPRYFVVCVPGLILLMALGYQFFKNNVNIPFQLVILLSISLFTYQSWLATQHSEIREIARVVSILQQKYPNAPIYSTFEMDKLGFYMDTKVELLSNELFESGGIVMTDVRKTEIFADYSEPEFVEMKAIWEKLNNENSAYSLVSSRNHFPNDVRGNEFKVFMVRKI